MESLKSYTDKFFIQHKNELLKNYPGISPQRIYQELKTLSFSHYDESRNLERPYLDGSHCDFSYFFGKLREGIPLAYITGRAYFYKSEFIVNENVLIPRFETEVLVEKGARFISQNFKNIDLVKVADVGTGSGNIICSILRESKRAIKAYAIDISSQALEIADRNIYRLGFSFNPQSEVILLEQDRLKTFSTNVHLLVSNPPYIKENQKEEVHVQVDTYEPHQSLYLNEAKYDEWYEQFFKQINEVLFPDGIFIIEGHEQWLGDLKKIAEKHSFNQLCIEKDLTGKDRFLVGRK